jgi:hypothetical protein
MFATLRAFPENVSILFSKDMTRRATPLSLRATVLFLVGSFATTLGALSLLVSSLVLGDLKIHESGGAFPDRLKAMQATVEGWPGWFVLMIGLLMLGWAISIHGHARRQWLEPNAVNREVYREPARLTQRIWAMAFGVMAALVIQSVLLGHLWGVSVASSDKAQRQAFDILAPLAYRTSDRQWANVEPLSGADCVRLMGVVDKARAESASPVLIGLGNSENILTFEAIAWQKGCIDNQHLVQAAEQARHGPVLKENPLLDGFLMTSANLFGGRDSYREEKSLETLASPDVNAFSEKGWCSLTYAFSHQGVTRDDIKAACNSQSSAAPVSLVEIMNFKKS